MVLQMGRGALDRRQDEHPRPVRFRRTGLPSGTTQETAKGRSPHRVTASPPPRPARYPTPGDRPATPDRTRAPTAAASARATCDGAVARGGSLRAGDYPVG